MNCTYFDTTRKGNHSSFLTPTVVGGKFAYALRGLSSIAELLVLLLHANGSFIGPPKGRLYILPVVVSYLFLSFFPHQLHTEDAEWNSTKLLSHFGYEPDLQMHVHNLGTRTLR